MNEYKLFAQRIGLVGLVSLLSNLSGLILLPVLTKNIPLEDYGIWTQVNITMGLAGSIVLMGLSESLTRFMASSKERLEIQERFYSIFFMVLSSGFVFSTLVYLFSEPLATALFGGNLLVTRILSGILLLESMNSLLFYYFRTVQQMKRYSIFVFTNVYLNIALVSALILMGYGILGAVIALLITRVMIFLAMFILVISEIGFRRPEFKDARAYLAFGLPIVPSSLSSWVINSSDRYVIGLLIGTSAVGIYSPGYLLGNIIAMFIGPLNFVLPVTLFKHYDCNRIEEVEKLLSYSLKYYLAIAIPSAFGLSLLSRPILSILSTPQIAEQAYLITPFVALSMLLYGATSIVSNILGLKKRMIVLCFAWMSAAALNLVLTFILVSYIGIIGAAIATLVAFVFLLLVISIYCLRQFRFKVDLRFIAKSVIATLAMYFVIAMWPPSDLIGLFSVVIICVAVYVALLTLLGGLDKKEIEFFKGIFIG